MKKFHAVMIDETGCEFGVDLEAWDHAQAYEQLKEDYPESRCDQLEDEEQTKEREKRIYDRANYLYDHPWDDDYDY